MDMMRFPAAMHRDPAIDRWLASRASDLAPLAQHWFDHMRECGPDMRELMHDGCPVACVQDIAMGYVNVFAAHVSVGFFLGAELDDPAGLLQGAGKRMRHVKLRADTPVDEAALARLIEDAYEGMRSRLALHGVRP